MGGLYRSISRALCSENEKNSVQEKNKERKKKNLDSR